MTTHWLNKVKAIAIDLDGVVYHGSRLISGSDMAISRLREMGLQIFFVTNNSAKTRKYIVRKLSSLGVSALEQEVISSAHATGILLNQLKGNDHSSVMVIGSEDLKKIVHGFGLLVAEDVPVDFLVVGMDLAFNYEKIGKALNAVLNGAIFIACNRDATYPAEGGKLFPGCGVMVAAVEAACGRPPDFIVGKPETLLLEILAANTGLRAEQIIMVGDTLSSDIEMANRFGSFSAYVTGDGQLPTTDGLIEASIIIRSLADLPDRLKMKIR